jgi:hypothetical protein
MKKILLFLLLLIVVNQLAAQNNLIFKGGTGDGWNKSGYLQTSPHIRKGGQGDGWNSSNYKQFSTNIMKGGIGDGWASSQYKPAMASIMKGGVGDGWSGDNYIQAKNNLYKGGIADGWSSQKYKPTIASIYEGGIGDGWASTYTPLVPLPVIFLSFDAKKHNDVALLNWKMADDKDVISFDVERSGNAVQFLKIGAVNQDDALAMNYNFTDRLPLQGHNYYRLRILKKDGKISYTNTRVVIFGSTGATVLKVYPNPASTMLNIELPSDFTGMNTVVNVYNANGAIVAHMKRVGQQGERIEINTSSLAAGNYFLHAATDEKTAQAKFTVIGK